MAMPLPTLTITPLRRSFMPGTTILASCTGGREGQGDIWFVGVWWGWRRGESWLIECVPLLLLLARTAPYQCTTSPPS